MPLRNFNIEQLSDDAAESLIPILTERLRMSAYESGWPAEYIAGLNILVDNEYELFVDYPEDLQYGIENQEYGDINGLPNAAIRPFLYRSPEVVGAVLEQEILPELLVELGVF